MTSKDAERSAAIRHLQHRAAAADRKGVYAGESRLAGPARAAEMENELIERTLEIDAAGDIQRTGIEALEALLGEIGGDDRLTLRLSLTKETPLQLGIELAAANASNVRRQPLASALEFAVALLSERRAR